MITTTIKELESEELGFPKLMAHTMSTLVILFENTSKGTVLIGNDNHSVGHTASNWYSNDFEDLNKALILKNQQ